MDGPWTLIIGCHRGTITSRDTEQPRVLDTLDECRAEVDSAERWYRSIGYMIWFATAKGPNGEDVRLHPGNAYT